MGCLCTWDAFHFSNSLRCFWASVSLMPVPSRWYEPFGESLSRLTVDSKTTSEFTVFNLVIRLSKVNCWPFFLVSHVGREVRVEQLPAVSGNLPFYQLHRGCRLKAATTIVPFTELEKEPAAILHEQATGHPCRYGISCFYGRWWGWIVHVIQGLTTDSRR